MSASVTEEHRELVRNLYDNLWADAPNIDKAEQDITDIAQAIADAEERGRVAALPAEDESDAATAVAAELREKAGGLTGDDCKRLAEKLDAYEHRYITETTVSGKDRRVTDTGWLPAEKPVDFVIRKGNYRPDPDERIDAREDLSKLPPNVRKAMLAKDPDWDWIGMGDGTNAWLVMRCFDEGVEDERIAAVVKTYRYMR